MESSTSQEAPPTQAFDFSQGAFEQRPQASSRGAQMRAIGARRRELMGVLQDLERNRHLIDTGDADTVLEELVGIEEAIRRLHPTDRTLMMNDLNTAVEATYKVFGQRIAAVVPLAELSKDKKRRRAIQMQNRMRGKMGRSGATINIGSLVAEEEKRAEEFNEAPMPQEEIRRMLNKVTASVRQAA